MIEFKNVNFSYSGKASELCDFSAKFKDNQNYLIFGPSENDFCAIFDILCGFERNFKGEVLIDGSRRENLSDCNLKFSYITNTPVAFRFKSVYKNLKYVFDVYGLKYSKIDATNKIFEALKLFKVEHIIYKKFYKLTGIEKLKMLFARCYLKPSKLLFIDRPEDYGITTEELLKDLKILNINYILTTKNYDIFNALNAKKFLLSYGVLLGEWKGDYSIIQNYFYKSLLNGFCEYDFTVLFNKNMCIMSDRVYEISCDINNLQVPVDYFDNLKNVKIFLSREVIKALEKSKSLEIKREHLNKVLIFDSNFGLRVF